MNKVHMAEYRPLLASVLARGDSDAHNDHTGPFRRATYDERSNPFPDSRPSRAVEDDVLPETSALGRRLTWRSCFILVISRVIGSGIFATPGTIIREVGSPGLSLLLWLVGGVVAGCTLAVSLEYGSMLPRSGGDKVYLEFTYRRPRFLASVVIAVHALLLGLTASNCIIFSQYVLFALERDDASSFERKGVAAGLLVVVTFIHVVFPQFGVRTQNFFGWLKLALAAFMVLCGLYALLPDRESADMHPAGSRYQSWHSAWEDSVWSWSAITTALFKVFYSYAGLDNMVNVMNEVKNPVRTLKSVGITALATSCAMYLLINLAYLSVVPLDEIKNSGELIAALFFERVFGSRLGRTILPLAVALSAAGNVMVVSFALSRMKQEIARQGILPYSSFLSSTRPFGSPLGGFLLHIVPSFLVIVLPPSERVYSFILELEQYPAQILSLLLAFGLFLLRYRLPDLRRPFKAWLPAVAVKMAMSLALLVSALVPPKDMFPGGLFYATYAIAGTAVLLLGVLYWWIWTILIPQWRNYQLEEAVEYLPDGTSITKMVHIRRD